MDDASRDRLIEEHLPLVRRVFSRLRIGLPPHAQRQLEDDLLSAGAIGLIQAVDRYDSSKGAVFASFASYRIRGAMLDELRRQDFLSKQSRQRLKEIQRAWRESEQAQGRPAADEEVAARLGISAETLREELVTLGPSTLVFLDGLGAKPGDWKQFIPDPSSQNAEEIQSRREIQDRLTEMIGRLPEQERQVLRLLLIDELGQMEIAEVLGLSAARISQIYAKAVLRLQGWILPLFGQ
jgi:RNA polymerase sigma factor for flagellar operon FliA